MRPTAITRVSITLILVFWLAAHSAFASVIVNGELRLTLIEVLQIALKSSPTDSERKSLEQEMKLRARDDAADQATLVSYSGQQSGDHIRPVGPTTCQTNYHFLDSKLAKFTDPTLASLRQQLLDSSISESIHNAKAQGLDKKTAISQLIAQTKAYDQSASEAAQCARSFSGRVTDTESLMAAIQQGKVSLRQRCEGIEGGCVCGFVTNSWGALMTRASITQFSACWK